MKHLISVLSLALALPVSAHAAEPERTVEWAPFAVVEGVTETQLLAASDKLQKDFLRKQSGFLKRELLHEGGRNWVDIVYWASREDAEKAMKAAQSSEACSVYFSLMNAVEQSEPEAGVKHFRIVRTWSDRSQ